MKHFLDEHFLLKSDTAQHLYENHAKNLPIIDYHCHLSPKDIAENRKFKNLTQIWLEGDHYKWRALRANGINEEFITGKASDFEKFTKWAETVPYTMKNPLYHWTHMELLRPFGIRKVLNAKTAAEIYEEVSQMLQTSEYSVRGILNKMNVEVICTTDDPVDNLEYHAAIKKDAFKIKVLPTWRPDKAMAVDDPDVYNKYIHQLELASNKDIASFKDLLDALQIRQNFFEQNGCRISDHGLETFYSESYTDSEINQIFSKIRKRVNLDNIEILKFKSAMLYYFAEMDHAKGWAQQFHIDVIRNNNTKMFRQLGPDAGYDTMGDFEIARPMVRFFDRLEMENKLAKTIVYNLNPRENELISSIVNCYNDGNLPGKMQYGAAWWFLDQKDGIEKQLTTLSNFGLLSRFVGMLTDSRSFLSYPRHDYFRRILCNLIGNDIENGEIPIQEINFIENMIENISYHNAKQYFNF